MILLLIPFLLFAAVNVKVNSTKIIAGENLFITIIASGRNIKFPKIEKIGNYLVKETSNTSNIVMINGEMKETITKTYVLTPEKNLTIPSFNILVNGKIEKTKPIKITVIPPKQTKGEFVLSEFISKKELFLGESALLTITFNYKKEFESVNVIPPNLDNFYVKFLSKSEEKNRVIYKFLIIPQKSGIFKLTSKADVGVTIESKITDPFFNMVVASLKYKRIYSNTITLKVKPIPKNSVFGDFQIELTASKKILANKPNRAKLVIKGCGDFIDMKEFDLKIKNATVYKEKPKLKTFIKDDKLCGNLIQTFNIIASNSYTIPSIILKTFKDKTKIVSTKPIDVTVINKKNEKPIYPKNEKDSITLYLIIGILSGILIGILILIALKKSLYFKVKMASDKELFNLLIEFKDDKYIKEVLEKLEENIYKKVNHKIDRKKIVKKIKSLQK